MYPFAARMGWVAKGKCTMGRFYGFKLHLVINDRIEIIQWMLTPGNVDDRDRSRMSRSLGSFSANCLPIGVH